MGGDIIYRNLVNMVIDHEATIRKLRARVAELEEFIRFGLAEESTQATERRSTLQTDQP